MDTALFDFDDFAELNLLHHGMSVGADVTLPHGVRGRIVSSDASRAGWWLVKLSDGRFVSCTPSSLDLS